MVLMAGKEEKRFVQKCGPTRRWSGETTGCDKEKQKPEHPKNDVTEMMEAKKKHSKRTRYSGVDQTHLGDR
jgi:hypothetical protein